MKKSALILLIFFLVSAWLSAQEVFLKKEFPSIEMTAVKMYDQTTLYRIDTIPIKLGQYKIDEIACNVFLKDMNRNNKFNDIGIDEIGLLDKFTDTIYHSYQGGISFAPLNESPAILVDDMLLKIDSIAQDGSYLKCNEIEYGSKKALVWTITYLPDIKLKTLRQGDKKLVEFLQDEKYIYLEFWGTWCEPCVNLIPELEQLDSLFKDKLTIISMNYGDKIEDVTSFVNKRKMSWTQAMVERDVLNIFSVTTVPRGILFNKAGALVDMDISPFEIKKLLGKE